MSSDSNVVKNKTRKGVTYLVIGIILTIPMILNSGYFISGFPVLLSGNYCQEIYYDCGIYMLGGLFLYFIGIGVFLKGVATLAKRKKLSLKEVIKKSDIDRDKRIKELEKRLEGLEEKDSNDDEKAKS